MKLSFLTLLFSLLSTVLFAQKRYMVDSYDSSFYHIKQLKTAQVIVRLKTNENSIYYLKAQGRHHDADYLRRKQLKKNKEIADAFQQMFTFTDFKFFYSTHSLNVKNGFYEGIFLNDSLESDESIALKDTSNLYIIDVGDVYFPSFGTHLEGIVIMDKNFKVLAKPFPYYVRKRSGFFLFRRTYSEIVKIFNTQLLDFYDYTVSGGEYESIQKRKKRQEIFHQKPKS